LSEYGLILPPQRQTTFQLVDLVFQQRKVPFHVAIEVGGWDVIKRYVAQGWVSRSSPACASRTATTRGSPCATCALCSRAAATA
jgi:hypothetical protein